MSTHSHSGTPSHGHTHPGTDTEMDWEALADNLEGEGELHLPFTQEAAAWIRQLTAEGGRGAGAIGRVLDVGSGPGVATSVFAREFPEAETVAVDGTPALLERAGQRARQQGLSVTTLPASLPEDFAELGTADVIWTSHVVHHLPDQQAALGAFAGLLRPGGVLAVVEQGLSPRFLPRDIGIGRPGLQARLEAVQEDWFTEMRAALPGHVDTVEDWPMMLSRTGLQYAGSRTFLTEYRAPLDAWVRVHLQNRLKRTRETVAERPGTDAADDLAVLDELLDGESPEGILQRPDAFWLSATTVHTGRARLQ